MRPAPFLVLLVVPVVLLAPAARATDDVTPPTLDELVEALVASAPPPGRKDLASTLRPIAVGYALWDTAEARAGYNGRIAGLVLEALAGCPPSPSYTELEQDENTTPLREAEPGGAESLENPIYPFLFTAEFSRFSYTGPGNDFDLAFNAPGSDAIDFFASQNTVFSPHDACAAGFGSGVSPYGFPTLKGPIAALAQARGLTWTQNVGFANNFAFPTGHHEFALGHPMITKHALVPPLDLPGYDHGHSPDPLDPRQYQVVPLPWDLLYLGGVTPGEVPESFFNIPMNLVHPEVASMLKTSIRQAVQAAFPYDAGLRYNTIAGEFFVAWKRNRGFDGGVFGPPVDCDGAIDETNYFPCLANTDYSDHSYAHFRRWLAERYGDPQALADAWGWPAIGSCADVSSCAAIDPLAAEAAGADLQAVYDDWKAFQEHQEVEARAFQYRAAEEVRPQGDHFTLEHDVQGFDLGALRSDGVASGNWYADNATRLATMTPMKKRALHAATYGESLNFPVFGMPRDLDFLDPFVPCEEVPEGGNVPDTFLPPCWDEAFSRRTLHEFLALGVDSLGLAYWENVANWTLDNGSESGLASTTAGDGGTPTDGVPIDADVARWTIRNGFLGVAGSGNLAQVLAQEAALWRTRRAFMGPWRSPMLVAIGAAASDDTGGAGTTPYVPLPVDAGGVPLGEGPTGMTDWVVELLGRQQVHYAPYHADDALDDLWAPRERELFFTPFDPALTEDALAEQRARTAALGLDLLAFTDVPTLERMLDDGLEFELLFTFPFVDGPLVHVLLDTSGPIQDLWAFPMDTPAAIQAIQVGLEGNLVAALEGTLSRALRPVTARVPGTNDLVDTVDLTVAHDGLNLLVHASTTERAAGVPQTFELAVDPSLVVDPVKGHEVEGGATITDLGLADPKGEGLGTRLVFVEADVDTSGITLGEVDAALLDVELDLDAREIEGYDVSAARLLADELAVLRNAQPLRVGKILAGLARLDRMILARYEPLTAEVVCADRSGDPVSGARVQLEFPMQHRARRAAPDTGVGGRSKLDVSPVPGARTWDFVAEVYVEPDPDDGDTHLMAIEVQHPSWASQTSIVVDPGV